MIAISLARHVLYLTLFFTPIVHRFTPFLVLLLSDPTGSICSRKTCSKCTQILDLTGKQLSRANARSPIKNLSKWSLENRVEIVNRRLESYLTKCKRLKPCCRRNRKCFRCHSRTRNYIFG